MIKTSEVVEKMKQNGAVDDLFKIDFRVVMANALIRSKANNFVTQSIFCLMLILIIVQIITGLHI